MYIVGDKKMQIKSNEENKTEIRKRKSDDMILDNSQPKKQKLLQSKNISWKLDTAFQDLELLSSVSV